MGCYCNNLFFCSAGKKNYMIFYDGYMIFYGGYMIFYRAYMIFYEG